MVVTIVRKINLLKDLTYTIKMSYGFVQDVIRNLHKKQEGENDR